MASIDDDDDARKRIGQLFVVGFHGYSASAEVKTLIRTYGVGGVVLFERNIRDAEQLQSLVRALQQEARDAGHEHSLFIGIDQENGLVTRICPPIVTQLPGAMTLGATGVAEHACQVARATGDMLRFFGINTNYAPVGDVNSEPLNPVIGVRSPGDNPHRVAGYASAAAKGFRQSRIIPCIKHFPGHGDTKVDSHYGLPVMSRERADLERCELIPFRRATAEGIESVMTAHIKIPNIESNGLPASLSPAALDLLRTSLNYDGMVVTDCLEMDGVRSTYGTEAGSVLAFKAGNDSVMICHTYDVQVASIEKVYDALKSGEISPERIDEALGRVRKVKAKHLQWNTTSNPTPMSELATLNKAHDQLSREIYSKSTTLVRAEEGTLPLSGTSKTVFLSPGQETALGGAVHSGEYEMRDARVHAEFIGVLRGHNRGTVDLYYTKSGLLEDSWKLVKEADAVILETRNAHQSTWQRDFAFQLAKLSLKLIVIATCDPYDFLDDAQIKTYITIYEPTLAAFIPAVDVIFGLSRAQGTLPIGKEPAEVTVTPFDSSRDLEGVSRIWQSTLPTYPVSIDKLRDLLNWKSGHHFVAHKGSVMIGFCAAYTSHKQDKLEAHISVLIVDPDQQRQGSGTALVMAARDFFLQKFGIYNLAIGSTFPRFWPGLPVDLPASVADFFLHRGFRMSTATATTTDLYQDIRSYDFPQSRVTPALEAGYTFAPLEQAQHEECMKGQKRNFSGYSGWVEAYAFLQPEKYPSNIMVAFSPSGEQIAWTLMLDPSSSILSLYAFAPLCGPNTGLIACVGVDQAHRGSGVSIPMLAYAIEDMRRRGIEGVLVDWVAMKGFYEKAGFSVWREYRSGEI
ncbi:MAG: hypothetical protein M1819_005500 [Sarea resinae]|nr:MAG: hypothetical protein M1819_005500 [Sarea resinae]